MARRGLANVEFVNPGLDDRGMPEQAFQVEQERAGNAQPVGLVPASRCLVAPVVQLWVCCLVTVPPHSTAITGTFHCRPPNCSW